MESVVCSIPADVQQTVDVDQDRSPEANASGDQSQPVATILVNRLPCDKIRILSTMRYSVVAGLPKDALRLIFDASTCSLRQSTCRAMYRLSVSLMVNVCAVLPYAFEGVVYVRRSNADFIPPAPAH